MSRHTAISLGKNSLLSNINELNDKLGGSDGQRWLKKISFSGLSHTKWSNSYFHRIVEDFLFFAEDKLIKNKDEYEQSGKKLIRKFVRWLLRVRLANTHTVFFAQILMAQGKKIFCAILPTRGEARIYRFAAFEWFSV